MVVVLVDLWVDEMGFEMVGKKVVAWVAMLAALTAVETADLLGAL